MVSCELPPKVPVVRVPEDTVNVEVLSKVAAESVPPDKVCAAVPELVVREATVPPDWLNTPAPAVVTAVRVLPVVTTKLAAELSLTVMPPVVEIFLPPVFRVPAATVTAYKGLLAPTSYPKVTTALELFTFKVPWQELLPSIVAPVVSAVPSNSKTDRYPIEALAGAKVLPVTVSFVFEPVIVRAPGDPPAPMVPTVGVPLPEAVIPLVPLLL